MDEECIWSTSHWSKKAISLILFTSKNICKNGYRGNLYSPNQSSIQAYVESSKTWECYVNGTIAFLEKNKEALETPGKLENQMNIEFLEKFVRYFDLSYSETMNAK